MVRSVHPDDLAKAMKDPAAVRSSTVGRVTYHKARVNYCPGCDRTQWWVGRVTAECAFCHTAVPLAEPTSTYARVVSRIGRSGRKAVVVR